MRYPSKDGYIVNEVINVIDPRGIAIDPVNRHLYWTDLTLNQIVRCDSDGSNAYVILNETHGNLHQPYAIAIDVVNR